MKTRGTRILAAILISLLGHLAVFILLDRPKQVSAHATLHVTLNWQPKISEKEMIKESGIIPPPALEEKKAENRASAMPQPPEESAQIGLSPYYEAKELDTRPAILDDIPIDPPELRNESTGGSLILKLWINAFGRVDAVDVVQSALPPAFEQQAIKAFKNSRFSPGIRHGAAVGSTMLVEMNYLPISKAAGVEYLPPGLLEKQTSNE